MCVCVCLCDIGIFVTACELNVSVLLGREVNPRVFLWADFFIDFNILYAVPTCTFLQSMSNRPSFQSNI